MPPPHQQSIPEGLTSPWEVVVIDLQWQGLTPTMLLKKEPVFLSEHRTRMNDLRGVGVEPGLSGLIYILVCN